jgi:hypothetical protein
MLAHLPDPAFITRSKRIADMICLSELSRIDPRIVCPDLHKLASSMTILTYRYEVDRLNFQELDKFPLRAVIYHIYSPILLPCRTLPVSQILP